MPPINQRFTLSPTLSTFPPTFCQKPPTRSLFQCSAHSSYHAVSYLIRSFCMQRRRACTCVSLSAIVHISTNTSPVLYFVQLATKTEHLVFSISFYHSFRLSLSLFFSFCFSKSCKDWSIGIFCLF